MVDDIGQSHTDAAPVQFGIFDWIDRNQLQLPDLYEQRLQCLALRKSNARFAPEADAVPQGKDSGQAEPTP